MNSKIDLDTEFLLIDDSIDSEPLYGITYNNIKNSLSEKLTSSTKGMPGDQGERGETGETGAKGEKGLKGGVGQIGYTGLQGESGEKGLPGTKGRTGQKGNPGEDGIQGQKGTKGIAGDLGEVGLKGIKGYKGYRGSRGQDGLVGDKGEKGIKGKTGILIKGQKGRKGMTGLSLPGDRGDRGQKGKSGQRGHKGQKGLPGKFKNIITHSIDINGDDWEFESEDTLRLNLKKEFSSTNSIKILKIKRGLYYNRFLVEKDMFAQIGTQLNDPLRNCYSLFNQYIIDTQLNIEIPLFVLTEEKRKVEYNVNGRHLVYNTYLVCRIFFDNTKRLIPFSVWSTDTY